MTVRKPATVGPLHYHPYAPACAATHALLAGLLVLVVPGRARCDASRRPALHWSRAPNAADCVDPRSLAQRVEAITGPVFVSASEADLSIEGHVDRPAPGRVHAYLSVSERRGPPLGGREVSFEVNDCRAIDAAIALVIAVLIDPSLGAETLPDLDLLRADEMPVEQQLLRDAQASPPRLRRSNSTLAPPARSPPSAASYPSRSTPRHSWGLGLNAGFGTDAFPGSALSVAIVVRRAVGRRFDLELALRTGFGLVAKQLASGVMVHSRSAGVGMGACPKIELDQLWLRGCAGAELGIVAADGDGFDNNALGVVASYGPFGRVSVEWLLSSEWRVALGGSARVNLSRARFLYRVDTDAAPALAYRLSGLGLEGQVGLVYVF